MFITSNRAANQVSNPHLWFMFSAACFPDQLRNSYQIGYDGSLRIISASGLDSHYQTEPHVLAGTANPTVAKRNMTLPGDNGQNVVEWRFRKEQAQGKVNVFGRKLRVSKCQRRADGSPVLCAAQATCPEGGPRIHLLPFCPAPRSLPHLTVEPGSHPPAPKLLDRSQQSPGI